jgi:membrane protein YqaA with SNARE-associated domain
MAWFARLAARVLRAAQRPYFPLLGVALAFGATLLAIAFVPVLCMLVVARQRRWGVLVVACSLGSALGATLLAWLVSTYGTQILDYLLSRLARTQEWQTGTRWVDAFGFAALLAVAALPLSQTPVLIVCALMAMPMTEIFLSVFAGKLIKYSVSAAFVSSTAGRLMQSWPGALNTTPSAQRPFPKQE